jgi:MYND finger
MFVDLQVLAVSAKTKHECSCGMPATLRCSGCKDPWAWYCGKECQREMWPTHIFDCNPRKPIITAYHLARACIKNEFPEDPQTCDDYGFTKAFTVSGRSKLLGLYIGLLHYHKVSPRSLHQWRKEGRLVEMIRESYEKLPPENRGEYYPWFLENQYVLDHSKSSPTDPAHDTMMRGWRYAGGPLTSPSVEEMTQIRDTWPETKQKCFNLCALLLSDWYPSVEVELWVDFGFCVSQSIWEEKLVSALYTRLIATCTFDEFYTAYSSSTLIALFHAKGLGTDLQNIRHLEDVLEHCSVFHKSVWDLKQYVLAKEIRLIPPVAVDYGFISCKSEEERNKLKEVYKGFFDLRDADPIGLHEAAIRGRLFEYVGGFVKLPKKCKRLMKNIYPLAVT